MNPIHPKKLLLTKWTAVKPEPPAVAPEWIEIEAVHSKTVTRIHWQELRDTGQWRQGWV